MSTGYVTKTTTGNSSGVAKNPQENLVTITVVPTAGATAFTGLQFTVEGSVDGTNYEPVAVVDNKTGLLSTGGTALAPTDETAHTYTMPLATNYTKFRVNVSAITTGSATFLFNGLAMEGSPLFTSVAGAAGSFTNITASGTLGVTGLSTFTGGAVAPDNATIALGTGSDLLLSWDGTRFSFTQALANSEMRYGVDGAGIDQRWYGDTASTYMLWDQSADSLILNGAAPLVFQGTTGQPYIGLTDNLADALSVGISGSTDLLVLTTTDNAESVSPIGLRTRSSTAVAITGATTLKLSDSGGIFTVSQAAAYDIDLPSPTTGPGCSYEFSLTAAGANDVTITVAGSAATFVGILQNDVTGTVPCTGSTLTYKSGVSALGDMIQIRSIATNLYRAFAACSANGGITIT